MHAALRRIPPSAMVRGRTTCDNVLSALKPSPRTLSWCTNRGIKMAAFSDPSFDFKGYLANRPRYPDLLYNTVLDFHTGDRDTVLDAGTGPGLSLFPFAYHFRHLIGADPSAGMMEQAEGAWKAWKRLQDDPAKLMVNGDARFITCSAERMEGVPDHSIDLITAATAAHWFDYAAVWPELARVLKPGGTVAFWTYGPNFLPSHPSLAPAMREFMDSKSTKLGPYWPQPGRGILENLLLDIPFPFELPQPEGGKSTASAWEEASARRVFHKLASRGIPDLTWTEGKAPEETFRMELVRSFDALSGYFHTSSASARFFKEHPKLKDEKPDMIDRHVEDLRKAVLEQRRNGTAPDDGLDDNHVRVAWPLGMMMIRTKRTAV